MQVDKVVEVFQTMAIVNLNMGNLNLEVSSLKNRLTIKGEKEGNIIRRIGEGEGLLEGYKHNIKIWRKERTNNEHKIKMLMLMMKEENEELKEKTWLMKS